ncbi:unnamed protein product [Larinioides sclopetarius]|uniref:very-long-chain enoyl-CoA reductase n=1 Tax=Larinioides sclopetarius TaxID=280406 RepID=A0AAV2AZR9_9ARAC
MEIEILQSNGSKPIAHLKDLSETTTINDIKNEIRKIKRKLHPCRQALRLEPRGKFLGDHLTLQSLEFKGQNKQLYLKDLGPQIGWKTVFLFEYAGPLALYVATYFRPAFMYGADASKPIHPVVHIAVICWIFHYSKRLLETLFVHRFSHATMPIRNLFKLAELGNLSIHLALRNLRPEGSTERKIPMPTSNPFTWLFNFVSCPNYTYEVMAWVAFTVMTNSMPAGLFATAGFYQMAVWALGKHRNYKKEFSKYPKGRKAILPFIL